jgi:hypothetical protein
MYPYFITSRVAVINRLYLWKASGILGGISTVDWLLYTAFCKELSSDLTRMETHGKCNGIQLHFI